MTRIARWALVSSLCWAALLTAAVRGDEAMYVGGTISAVPQRTEGRLEVGRDICFKSEQGQFSIAFEKVLSLEYGQKVGRRVATAVTVTPFMLLSKKRKHFLTIGFEDGAGQRQGAVLELSKNQVFKVLPRIEELSGKRIEFESADAQRQFEKEAH